MNGYNNYNNPYNNNNVQGGNYPTGVNPGYNMQQPGMNPNPNNMQPMYGAVPPKKNTGLIIGIVLTIVLLVVIGVIVVFAVNSKKDKKEEPGQSGTTNEKVTTCSLYREIDDGTTLDAVYTVTADGDYVTRVQSVEVFTSDSSYYLDTMYNTVMNTYSPYNGLKYYEYDVEKGYNSITSTVDINYAKIDTDRMLEIEPSNSAIIQNGKVNASTLISVYQGMGATCR